MDNEVTPTEYVKTEKPIIYENCEWCFQFDNDEPYVFVVSKKNEGDIESPKVTFTLHNTPDSKMTFSYNGKSFKIFARELTEVGEKIIKKDE